MSKSNQQHETTTGNLNLPDDVTLLGVDGAYSKHYYSHEAHTVVVVDTADLIERRQQLTDRSLTTWVTHIAEKHGWQDLRHAESFVEILASSLDTTESIA